ncbi:hypothetical protein CC85DRAFT_99081 [Cutaneotrichosporon oleaginosum]|uniref:Uncharacterized protein n=1 Tax=Cutaneotrichosporon oleaginosum TaxID=879819 RepID=A0A0J0XLV0_9TREE|nr:uncharacterized protein CC85DRAFT_99081 [Cutaneotrichosporon oleaginosum]KLT42091.1 hypothetical protein CC85DRAFT_99081 [Cutaneotrichosporon oleaginosum]TXT04670.1 hypothetical protein COLE_07489 [Cutaneotrichosporon oleaginosum]
MSTADDVASIAAPSVMSSKTAASTAGTSPPTSPRSTADLRADLKAALAAKAAAETRASVLEAELARFKDQFTFAHAAKEALEAQLREETARREKAEEQVENLRGAVEAARRGVMQLQKQESDRAARRQSGFFEEETTTAKKRQSLYLGSRRPVSQGAPEEKKEEKPGGLRELRLGAGAGHAREKSTNLRAPPPLNVDNLPPSPRRAGLSPRSPRHSPPSLSPPASASWSPPKSPVRTSAPPLPVSPLAIPKAERRTSALSVASTSSALATSPTVPPVSNEHIEQLKSARVETAALRAHIEALEMKLAEADEARAASEDCLRALREFLAADPEAGGGSVSLPPLPHEIDDEEEEPAPKQEKKGWGFGLWQGSEAPKRRGSSSAPSIAPSTTSVTSPAPTVEALPPVFENEATVAEDAMALDKPPPPPKDEPKKDETKEAKETKGWLGGWRTNSTPAPPPAPEPSPPEQGANLGRSLTSFFGRRARAASLAAAKAEADKADADAYSKEREEDAPLSSAVAAAAAAETSEFGFKLPPSESEGSIHSLAARAERISGDDDTASRVAAAKAKAEMLAAERAEKRRARAAERLPGAMTADQILKAQEEKEDKAKADAKPEIKAEPLQTEEKAEDEEEGLAYLAEEPTPASPTKPALSVATAAAAASALSPPASSPAFGFDARRSPSLDAPRSPHDAPRSPVARARRNSPTSSPVSPALSRSSVPPSPNPEADDQQEELADEEEKTDREDKEEKAAHVPKRPQRRNASKRGRGAAKVARGAARGGFV